MGKNPNYTIELLRKCKKKIIAKKVLAAGRIPPQSGLAYLKTLNIADGLTVGIASEKEMDQTFQTALELWSRNEI